MLYRYWAGLIVVSGSVRAYQVWRKKEGSLAKEAVALQKTYGMARVTWQGTRTAGAATARALLPVAIGLLRALAALIGVVLLDLLRGMLGLGGEGGGESGVASNTGARQIGNVVKQSGGFLVYDTNGGKICSFTAAPNAVCTHFTTDAITIQTGRQVRLYSADGRPGRGYNV